MIKVMDPQDEKTTLIKFLGEIPPPLKEAAELFYVENMTQKAIAEKLNLSIGMTRQRLSKAKFLLKKLSGSEDYKAAYRLMYGRDHL